MIINFKELNTKEKFLQYMKEHIDDMYACNYDALIDALTCYKTFTLKLENIEHYEDKATLFEIIEVLQNDFPNIKILF